MDNFIHITPQTPFLKDNQRSWQLHYVYGKRVLLIYGRSSIKENGVYNEGWSSLKA